jgi:hypothetical protein
MVAMRISTCFVAVALIASCYVHTAPAPAYAPQPGYAAATAPPAAAPAGSLTGRWQVTAVVPPGQPHPGTYTTTWELTDSGGQLWAGSLWSNGARSRYAGWVRGNVVHFDRTDENGFRGTFDGTLSPDGGTMTGEGRNDPASPGGNTASYTWTAQRIGAAPPPAVAAPPPPPPPAASVSLSGRWQVTAIVPSGQPYPGTYTTIWEVTDSGGQLWGTGVWSNGTRSRYVGWLRGNVVHLDRTDDNGFRGAFDGSLSPDGRVMSGSGRNDPSSPSGNSATYTWTAQRL